MVVGDMEVDSNSLRRRLPGRSRAGGVAVEELERVDGTVSSTEERPSVVENQLEALVHVPSGRSADFALESIFL
jgi:hypothetical protein